MGTIFPIESFQVPFTHYIEENALVHGKSNDLINVDFSVPYGFTKVYPTPFDLN